MHERMAPAVASVSPVAGKKANNYRGDYVAYRVQGYFHMVLFRRLAFVLGLVGCASLASCANGSTKPKPETDTTNTDTTNTSGDALTPAGTPTPEEGAIGGCDAPAQTGCETGQACYPNPAGSGDNVCEAPGTQTLSQACSETERCVGGLSCTKSSAQVSPEIRRCMKLCKDDSDCAEGGPGSQCALFVPRETGRIGLCTEQCNLVTSEECPTGLRCLVSRVNANWATFCAPPGTIAEGGSCKICGADDTSCNPNLDCAPGLYCSEETQGATTGVCRKFCRVGTADCAGGTQCRDFDGVVAGTESVTNVIVGGVSYGGCR